MAFFKFLKRKPGGTIVGNFLRGASNQLSGGILGNGAALLPPKVSDPMQLGQNMEQIRREALQQLPTSNAKDNSLVNIAQSLMPDGKLDLNNFIKLPTIEHGVEQKTQKNTMIIFGVLAAVVLIFIFKKR